MPACPRPPRRAVASLVLLSLLVAACADDRSPVSAGGDGVSVAAAVYPLAWLARQVAPDADVSQLGAGGLEAHDLEITPGQRGAIQTSDVVLFVGAIGYQPQVEGAVITAEGEVVSLSEVAGPDRLLDPAPSDHGEGDGHEADGAPAAEADVEVDPHIWFDADVMADAALSTGEALAASDPGNAAVYRQNAETLHGELTGLRTEVDQMLGGDCRHDEVIVSHQAYGYLLAPYGVEQHGVSGINPEAGASSAELAELVEEIESEGFEHVLTEPAEGRAGAETVAREADVELVEISPLDAVSDEQAEIGFMDLVRAQAAAFATALGC